MPTTQTKSLLSVANHAHPGDVVFFDIDDTVLLPGIQKYEDMPEAMKEAVEAIRLLEDKGVNVVFLTARHGDKEKIFSGTFQQLQALGLKPKSPARFNFEHLDITFENSLHRYHDGVIFAKKIGEHEHKGAVLKQFLEQLPETPKRIWMIDDQLAELESIAHQNFEGLAHDPVPRLFQFLPYQSIFQGLNSAPQTAYDRAMEPETKGSSSAPPMPENLEGMAVLDHLEGGSGGVFVLQDTKTGKKYTLKTATSEEQLSDEILADRLYQLFGVPVPSFAVFDSIPGQLAKAIHKKPKGLFRLSEFIEADETLNTEAQLTQNPDILDQFADGFLMDAVLANYNVANDTKVQAGSKLLYHLDNSCNLRNTAGGGFKETSSIVDEIDSLRSQQSNPGGQILYQNVNDPFIKQKVRELLERFPQIIDELYDMNRVLNIKGGTELIQLITDRIVYLKHRFCPDFKLNIPHHPADDYTSASILIITTNEQSERCVVLGERAGEFDWFGDFGGKSEKGDEDLSTTAAREALEETSDLIPLPAQGLKAHPYHDLLKYTGEGKPMLHLHRMYVVNYRKDIPIDELQAFASGKKRSRHVNEYTDFKKIPLKAIQKAIKNGPQEHFNKGTRLSVCLVELDDGTTISLHPPFAEMLAQPETQKHLDCLDSNEPYQPPNKGFMLKTPKEIAHDIAKQAVNKSQFLREFKQHTAPELQKRQEEHTWEEPEARPNEGPSGLHQAQSDYLSQTEIYLQSVLGEHFNPDPACLEKNVDYFLNEVSKFKDNPDFQNQDHRQRMIDIILKEREAVAKGELVLYHAAETAINFIIDFFTELRRQLFAESREGYRAFRAIDSLSQAFEHIDALIELFSQGGTQGFNNYDTFFQEVALSCNPFLFGNDGNQTSSSLSILFANKSQRPPNMQNLISQIMASLGMGETEVYAVLQLFEPYQKIHRGGKLYQICVDRSTMDQMSYPSVAMGIPNPLDEETKLSQILTHLSDNPKQHQAYIKELQARLLLNPKRLSNMHVNEFQATRRDVPSSSQTLLANEIKHLSNLLAEKILAIHQRTEAFANRSGIINQTQALRREFGIPVEAENITIKLVKAICTENVNLVFEIIKQYPELDLRSLPNVYHQNEQGTSNVLDMIHRHMFQHAQKITQHIILYNQNWIQLVTNPFQFEDIIKALKDAERKEFLERMKPKFHTLINNQSAFTRIYQRLKGSEKKEFFDAIKPELLIQIGLEDFHTIFRILEVPERQELFEIMKPHFSLVISTYAFELTLKMLKGSEREEYFELMKPAFHRLARSPSHFESIYSILKKTKREAFFEIMKPRFHRLVRDASDFKMIYQILKNPDREEFFEIMRPHLHELINDGSDFKMIFQSIEQTEQRKLFNILKEGLFLKLIQNSVDLQEILQSVSLEESIILTNLMPCQSLLKLQQNLVPGLFKKRRDWLKAMGVGQIIIELEAYIEQDQNKSFTFFNTSRALNNQANILLAEALRKELMPEGIPDDAHLETIFNEDFIMETRERIIQAEKFDKDPNYKSRGINSTTLNDIIQDVRDFGAPIEETRNPEKRLVEAIQKGMHELAMKIIVQNPGIDLTKLPTPFNASNQNKSIELFQLLIESHCVDGTLLSYLTVLQKWQSPYIVSNNVLLKLLQISKNTEHSNTGPLQQLLEYYEQNKFEQFNSLEDFNVAFTFLPPHVAIQDFKAYENKFLDEITNMDQLKMFLNIAKSLQELSLKARINSLHDPVLENIINDLQNTKLVEYILMKFHLIKNVHELSLTVEFIQEDEAQKNILVACVKDRILEFSKDAEGLSLMINMLNFQPNDLESALSSASYEQFKKIRDCSSMGFRAYVRLLSQLSDVPEFFKAFTLDNPTLFSPNQSKSYDDDDEILKRFYSLIAKLSPNDQHAFFEKLVVPWTQLWAVQMSPWGVSIQQNTTTSLKSWMKPFDTHQRLKFLEEIDIETIFEWSCNLQSFLEVMDYLSPGEFKVILNKLKDVPPQMLYLLQNIETLNEAAKNAPQKKQLLGECLLHADRYYSLKGTSPIRFDILLSWLPKTMHPQVYSKFFNFDCASIEDFFEQNNQYGAIHLLKAMTTSPNLLKHLLRSNEDFRTIKKIIDQVPNLEEEERSMIIKALEDQQAHIIMDIKDLELAIESLSDEQAVLLFNHVPYSIFITQAHSKIDNGRITHLLEIREASLNKTPIGNLIVKLENYIKQKQDKSFNFFSASRTPNNQANILLAEALRKELMPEGIPDASRLETVSRKDFIIETRNHIIETEGLNKNPDFKPSSIHSTALNNIIQEASALAEQPPPPQNNL